MRYHCGVNSKDYQLPPIEPVPVSVYSTRKSDLLISSAYNWRWKRTMGKLGESRLFDKHGARRIVRPRSYDRK